MSIFRTALSLALCASLAQPTVALAAVFDDPCEGGTPAADLPDTANLSSEEKLNWAKKLYGEAKGFHDSGNYFCSVIKYEQAYTFAPDKHLFAYNLGVDAWELKDCARVKHYMQLFMVNDESNADLRKDAKRILNEAENSAECVTNAGAAGSSGPTDTGSSGAPIEDTEEAPGLEGTSRGGSESGGGGGGEDKPKKSVSGMLIGGVVLSVIGLGVAGGGVALALSSKKKGDEIKDAGSTANMTGFAQGYYDASLEKSAKTLGLVGPVLIGAGGALLVGGIVMVVMDRGNKKKGKGAYANQRSFQLAGAGVSPLREGGGAASMTFRF
ncbi:MAG: hypothetical protein H6710_04040 [Myxococcales bacterium]|nr:hypothetical protein [Myxococcales bacterium]MCB9705764.1 hypothetical protein [Myxococcales bacterium]